MERNYSLNFDTGLISYVVNGVPNAVSFNPTDMGFVDKLLNFFEEFSRKHDSMSREIQSLDDNRKAFDLFEKMDTDLRSGINSLFGENASSNLFSNISCCAMAEGLPLWMNFVLAVFDEIQKACDGQGSELPVRLQKIVAKYKK